MANKKRVPTPPVQAPKRRDTPNRARLSLPVVPWWGWLAGGLAAAVAVGGVVLALSSGAGTSLPLEPVSAAGTLKAAPSAGAPGPEGVPIPRAKPLAPAGTIALGQTIDGISCTSSEMLAYHIHAHLTVFVRGAARRIPYGIGIAPPRGGTKTPAGVFVSTGACFAWLHTHAADGIVHIEAPARTTYTLGQFFDIWGQPLGRDRVGPAIGHVTAFFNGHVYNGDPRAIPLQRHAQIQLDVGRPLVAPETVSFPNGL